MNIHILDSEDEIPHVGTVQLKCGTLAQLVDCINYWKYSATRTYIEASGNEAEIFINNFHSLLKCLNSLILHGFQDWEKMNIDKTMSIKCCKDQSAFCLLTSLSHIFTRFLKMYNQMI